MYIRIKLIKYYNIIHYTLLIHHNVYIQCNPGLKLTKHYMLSYMSYVHYYKDVYILTIYD